ncbi:hypothetical protein QJS10_CPA02g00837 [Acorus calamus]|uniref:K Homology domain-containing protein n=1 Tax=Acorus calamus TaxID=4465 RepID=A0AAV9FGR6_ACOCL|nr:hypothetical protein QJS10_CPA02g00837 [Acorus calamus]
MNSGAKIQITRDVDADRNSLTRPVELIGAPENIKKAEQLIKDVIAEADAGGSPSLVARGFSTIQTGAEQLEIQVPNEKVGLIIGKGGETIKSLQTRSGARIQLIPQHLPEGDSSKERTVRVTGNKKQIDTAKEMIKEVMNQIPLKPSPLSATYPQQSYRPRGPSGPSGPTPHWGPPRSGTAHSQSAGGYDYPQRGMYPSQPSQYPPQSYSGYQQPPPQRSTYGWEQRPSHPPHHGGGGYDYYGQGGGGHVMDGPISGGPPKAHGPPQANYYGAPPASEYGQHASYPQSAPPPQHGYGHGYDEPKYDTQPPVYGASQPGAYPQQPSGGSQSGYGQQTYNKPPAYGMPPSQGPSPQSYGAPLRPAQEVPYQGPPASYGGAPQQQYPQQQQSYPYGPASDGYGQPAPGGPPHLILNRGSRLLHQVMLKAGMANPVGMVSTHNHNPVMASRSR